MRAMVPTGTKGIALSPQAMSHLPAHPSTGQSPRTDPAAVGWRETIRGLDDIRRVEQLAYDDVVPVRSTVQLLERSATLFPDRPAITFLPTGSVDDDPHVLTYRAFFDRVRRAANAFHRLGVGPDDAVAFLAPTLPDTFVTLFAAQACGRACPINYMLSPEKIAGLLAHAGAKVLVALGPDDDLPIAQKIDEIRRLSPQPAHVVSIGDASIAGVPRLADLIDAASAEPEFTRDIGRDDIAATYHTGGTTGSPKLVRHTHGNEVHASWFGGLFYGIGPDDVVINGFPLFHVAGAFVLGGSAFAAGANTIIPSKLGMRSKVFVEEFWRVADRHRVTLLSGGPTFVSTLLERTGPEAATAAGRIKALVGGGSPMPNELARNFEETFAIPLRSIYGMTEAAGLVSIVPRLAERVPGASGWRLPFGEIGVFALASSGAPDLDRPLPPGQTGGIAIRGPNLSPGYTDPALDAGTFERDGWVVTGDLGHLADDGQVFVTGRAKDVIIRGGHNIDPAGIEEALMRHPDVQLCAAVGQPDAHAGELPVAFVQRKPGAASTGDDILAATAPLIPERAAIPKRIHLLDALPLTTTGKIFKPALRLLAAEIAFADQLREIVPAGILGVACAETGAGRTARIRLSGEHADPQTRETVLAHMARFTYAAELDVE
ncbi:fatty-acyl-CoA synthase [Amorphus sp. MBR-141]